PAFDRNTIRGEPVGNVTSRIRMVRNVSAVAGNDSCRYPVVFANRADAVPWIGVALSSVTTPVAESTPVVGSSRPPSNVIWRTVVPPPGGGVGVGVGVGVAVGAGVGVAVGAGVGVAVPVGVGVGVAVGVGVPVGVAVGGAVGVGVGVGVGAAPPPTSTTSCGASAPSRLE